jgi:hypothetical protein
MRVENGMRGGFAGFFREALCQIMHPAAKAIPTP